MSAMAGVWISGLLGAPGDNNIFTQIGLMVLVGLACKNAILIVEFAKDLEEKGEKLMHAIVHATRMRLRPILMTTAAIVMAVIPLLIASGPGAVSRYHIGLVIVTGMSIGTVFTLFVLPVVYTYVAERREGVVSQIQANTLVQVGE